MKSLLTRKIAISAMLTALALIAFIIESLLPPLIIPGAKLGLSNFFILLSLVLLGYKYGFFVLIIKIVLGSLFSGNISTMMYSLPAGLASFIIEAILLNYASKFTIVSISIFGAIVNILVQNMVFCLVTGAWAYLIYSPYLALCGTLSGLIIGLILLLTVKKLPLSKYCTS